MGLLPGRVHVNGFTPVVPPGAEDPDPEPLVKSQEVRAGPREKAGEHRDGHRGLRKCVCGRVHAYMRMWGCARHNALAEWSPGERPPWIPT